MSGIDPAHRAPGLLLALLPGLLLALWLPLAAADPGHETRLPAADHLQRAAATAQAAGEPLLLMFSLPDCGYCRVVRRNYLLPMLRDGSTPKPHIRELTMTGREAIADFDGTVTTPAAIAKRYQVRVAPTLVFVNTNGDLLAESLVGGEHAFYDAALARAFDESRKALGRAPR
jgi:thioredoxin-related protein